MLLCDGFRKSRRYQESRCLSQFRARMITGLNKFRHTARTNTCPSSMSCQSCQLGHWCSNPIHINRQLQTKSAHASVKQWPLWENHSLHSEECLRRNVESWENLILADTSDLVLGRALVADAAVLRLPGILSFPGISLRVLVRARMSRGLNKFCHAGRTIICPRR